MRVLFVYSTRDCLSLRHPLPSLQDIHIGLSYISAFLKFKGHSTRLAVLDSEAPQRSFATVKQIVAEFDPNSPALRRARRSIRLSPPWRGGSSSAGRTSSC